MSYENLLSIFDAAFAKKPAVDRLPLIASSPQFKKFRLFFLQMGEKQMPALWLFRSSGCKAAQLSHS
jgi:hypothetical protein